MINTITYLFLFFIFIFCILAFIAFGWDKRRASYGKTGAPTGLLIPAAILGSFGALMGMLLFGTRLKSILFLILAPVMTVVWVLLGWLLL